MSKFTCNTKKMFILLQRDAAVCNKQWYETYCMLEHLVLILKLQTIASQLDIIESESLINIKNLYI